MKTKLTYLKKVDLFKALENHRDGEFFAVIDVKVKNHLPQWVQFSPQVYWLKTPESEKNLEGYGHISEFFLKLGIQRSSHLYAIGGGATSDVAGFVAATILRGIAWSAVPTTLLGMVDSAIGGKVALNMPQGKNLVGAFHLPSEVFICADFLTTLTEEEWLSGKGEILKYGFLSTEVHKLILKRAPIEEIAVACAKFKAGVVERDFLEQGERTHLNLGHTLGHAFESTLRIPHGQAVAMGLKYIFSIFKQDERLREWQEMVNCLELKEEKFALSFYRSFELKSFLDYLDQDKKKIESRLKLVLVKAIGSCYVEEVPLKEFKTKIQTHADFNH